MNKPMSAVQADFDRIAQLPDEGGWNHNSHYHDMLLRHVPANIGAALEIGCGAGEFARLLAARAERVLGVDLSAEMIRAARAKSRGYPQIEYQQVDVLDWDFPIGEYDCVASIATLHHLPLETMLVKMRDALRPGGVLLVLDLYQVETRAEWLYSGLAIVPNMVMRLAKTGRERPSEEARAAWDAHGKDDVYPRLSEVRRICADVLPGAVVQRHFYWRYSIVWRKAR